MLLGHKAQTEDICQISLMTLKVLIYGKSGGVWGVVYLPNISVLYPYSLTSSDLYLLSRITPSC